jgi:mRNA interferase RelE/StbE
VIKFRVELSSKAKKFYAACPKELARRLSVCFEELENDPYRGPNIKRLKTRPQERLYRYRIGDYRVVYEVLAKEIIVLVVKIAKRADVYKALA